MRMMNRLSGKRDSRNTEGPQLDVRVVRTNKVFKTHKGGKTASWSILVVVGDLRDCQVGIGVDEVYVQRQLIVEVRWDRARGLVVRELQRVVDAGLSGRQHVQKAARVIGAVGECR